MYVIESVVRKVDGKERIIKFLAGSGNLTSDLQLRSVTLKSGVTMPLIEGFGQDIAFDYFQEGEEKVKYFPLEVWGKTAEALAKFGKKGMEVTVTGRVEERQKEYNGNKHTKEVLVLELFKITSRNKQAKTEI